MNTGTEALATWISLGGFRLDHRQGKDTWRRHSHRPLVVPAREQDDLTTVHPCADQLCLRRALADCPDHDQVVHLACLYGLLTVSARLLSLRSAKACCGSSEGEDRRNPVRAVPYTPTSYARIT